MELLFIHLTDIHINCEEDYNILASRCKPISNVIEKHLTNPDKTIVILCVTGDIAASGKQEQYVWASLFFEEIIMNVRNRHDKIEMVFVSVPGNHDCDFDSSDALMREVLMVSPRLDLLNPTIISNLTSIQQEYFTFCDDLQKNCVVLSSNKTLLLTDNAYLSVDKNISLRFHCINTAWCSKKDEKKGLIGLAIPDIGKKSKDELVITLMHHDSAWLDWDGTRVWKSYHEHYSDIVFIGHDHLKDFVHMKNYDLASNYFIKGNQLYSSSNPEQSGFNVLKVNIENEMQLFYSYYWNGSLYENIINSKAQPFTKNRFMKFGYELKEETTNYLEEIGIDISSRHKHSLSLSDIYVYPLMKGESLTSKKSDSWYKDKESIIEFITEKKFVSIAGEKEYGKTALMKQLFKVFYEMELFPVFFNVDEIKSVDEEYLNNKMYSFYDNLYVDIEKEFILQMESEKKVCFIDNFEEISLSDKSIKKLLQYLTNKFGIVIITNDFTNDMINFFRNIETKEYLDNQFNKLTILDLNRFGKKKFIEKWLLLADPNQDVKSQEFDAMHRNKTEQVNTVMKNGFFSKTPIEFLLVLSYLDNYEKMSMDYSRYSYIYDSLILDKINEISGRDTNEATMYRTILEQLAYEMYEEKINIYFEESLIVGVIYNYNEEYRGNKGEIIDIIKKLEKCNIIQKKKGKYCFKFNYMYYYFTGSYIKNQMPPDIKDEKIMEIFSDLSKEINFNIALFLAYSLNAEFDILPRILEISGNLLAEFQDFKYENQRTLIEKLDYDIEERIKKIFPIPINEDIPQIQEDRALAEDISDESKHEEESSDDEKEEELEELVNELIKTLRIIEFLGNILKNYSSSIRRIPRRRIIELMNDSMMRIIGLFCENYVYMIDKTVEIVDEKLKSEDEKVIIAKSKFKQELIGFLSDQWEHLISASVSYLSFSLQSDKISNDISEFQDEIQSNFFNMVFIEYLIRIYDGGLPVKEIEKSFRGKNKLDTFSQIVLKGNIAKYLRTYQYKLRDKMAVCSILEFDTKNMLIEVQKRKIAR